MIGDQLLAGLLFCLCKNQKRPPLTFLKHAYLTFFHIIFLL